MRCRVAAARGRAAAAARRAPGPGGRHAAPRRATAAGVRPAAGHADAAPRARRCGSGRELRARPRRRRRRGDRARRRRAAASRACACSRGAERSGLATHAQVRDGCELQVQGRAAGRRARVLVARHASLHCHAGDHASATTSASAERVTITDSDHADDGIRHAPFCSSRSLPRPSCSSATSSCANQRRCPQGDTDRCRTRSLRQEPSWPAANTARAGCIGGRSRETVETRWRRWGA